MASTATTSSYGVDTYWYMDTGTTDHITSELEKLTARDKYHGGDQVQAANGSGIEITHIGHSTLRSHLPIFILQIFFVFLVLART